MKFGFATIARRFAVRSRWRQQLMPFLKGMKRMDRIFRGPIATVTGLDLPGRGSRGRPAGRRSWDRRSERNGVCTLAWIRTLRGRRSMATCATGAISVRFARAAAISSEIRCAVPRSGHSFAPPA